MKNDDFESDDKEKAVARLRDRFLLLPGESDVEYRVLQVAVAEELAPDGELEEDAVNTIVKCIWRKQRYQRFLRAKLLTAALRPNNRAYVQALGLGLFLATLGEQDDFDELERLLSLLPAALEDELQSRCPKENFSAGEDMNNALRAEATKLYERALCGTIPHEFLIESASVLTDDVFARELKFEEQIDAQLDRALDRLAEIRALKRQIPAQTRQDFNRRHVPRPVPVRKRKPRRSTPMTNKRAPERGPPG